MGNSIRYTTIPPLDFTQLLEIYDALSWNSLGFTVDKLERMCKGSWYALYAYDRDKLVGMGRVISDGIITGVICGLCVHPQYQSQGIGSALLQMLVSHCEQNQVIPQLMCVDSLVPYYEKQGFDTFTVGMKKSNIR
ncbi:acetyltransferase [Bacillus sp. FJAT-27225]|uniref:GNAT family N-acetyltransferase n=1 Tax=Bacillus sp. FJAT-27225 TaxID=1743144 RepID=UPI00080C2F12|nr:GNAT family N-acetyltransferase [Bacillus sp. FJAT-27225]OCA90553.1 acetyltransferase [Bacillus sp. FJAT-27225]